LRRLQRKLDRQQRANNPKNYNEDGTIRQGPKTWHKSNSQKKTEQQIAELHRKQAAYRKSLQGQLVNQILALGDDIRLEKLSIYPLGGMVPFNASLAAVSPRG
jgi:putative transposase